MDQLPRLGKRELICLLLFTCNYVVSVWRGFLFLWVLGMGYVILLWHYLSLPLIIMLDILFIFIFYFFIYLFFYLYIYLFFLFFFGGGEPLTKIDSFHGRLVNPLQYAQICVSSFFLQ